MRKQNDANQKVEDGRGTQQVEILEITAEDLGAKSFVKSLLGMLAGGGGTTLYQFVAQPRDAGGRPTGAPVRSDSFLVMRPLPVYGSRPGPLDHLEVQGSLAETVSEQFDGLCKLLLEQGWQLAGRGAK